MTREEFIAGYCARSGVTWEWLSQYRKVLPCECGEDICDGWAMLPQVTDAEKITDAMVEAGVRVLRESGLLPSELSVDYLVVRDMLVAALAVQKTHATLLERKD